LKGGERWKARGDKEYLGEGRARAGGAREGDGRGDGGTIRRWEERREGCGGRRGVEGIVGRGTGGWAGERNERRRGRGREVDRVRKRAGRREGRKGMCVYKILVLHFVAT